MVYVDGYVLPLAEAGIATYQAIAQKAGEIWMKHGALAYKECIAEDMDSEWAKDSFPKAVNAANNETVVFAFIIFKSKAHRDEVNAKVHQDASMAGLCDETNMPFDIQRMIYGGFTTIVDL
ncbi:MAG: DUF1428 domain-containing protein [Methylophilaceae bacterium]